MNQKPPGRNPIGNKPMRAVAITIPEEVAEYLRRLGDGNLSAGIREAARRLQYLKEAK